MNPNGLTVLSGQEGFPEMKPVLLLSHQTKDYLLICQTFIDTTGAPINLGSYVLGVNVVQGSLRNLVEYYMAITLQ
jgi:hypothetical protein